MKNNLIHPEFEDKLKKLKVFLILRYDYNSNIFVVDIVDNNLKDIRTGTFTNEDIVNLIAKKITQIEI